MAVLSKATSELSSCCFEIQQATPALLCGIQSMSSAAPTKATSKLLRGFAAPLRGTPPFRKRRRTAINTNRASYQWPGLLRDVTDFRGERSRPETKRFPEPNSVRTERWCFAGLARCFDLLRLDPAPKRTASGLPLLESGARGPASPRGFPK